MKLTMSSVARRASPKRLGVAQAKSGLSEALHRIGEGPTIIHRRGEDIAVLLDIEEYERLLTEAAARPAAGARFLERVAALKEDLGGGVDPVEPEPLRVVPTDPFSASRKRRG